jgi:exosortase family protein XrtM
MRHWVTGFAVFGAVYAALYALYMRIPDQLLVEVYYRVICVPGAALNNGFVPGAGAHADANRIVSANAVLQIVRGCDGAGVFFLLVAAIVAWRGRQGHMLAGLLGATAVVWLLNQARIAALYFAAAGHGGWFTPLHTVVFPTLFVLLALVFFSAWGAASARRV